MSTRRKLKPRVGDIVRAKDAKGRIRNAWIIGRDRGEFEIRWINPSGATYRKGVAYIPVKNAMSVLKRGGPR